MPFAHTRALHKNREKTGYCFVMLSGILFGTMPLLTKTAFSYGWNAYTAAFGRFFFGAIISLLAAVILPGTSLRLERKQLQKILPLSLIYAANPVLLYNSYRYVSSGLASTLQFTYPVIVMLMMALLFHSRPQKKQIVCVVLCALGILLLY